MGPLTPWDRSTPLQLDRESPGPLNLHDSTPRIDRPDLWNESFHSSPTPFSFPFLIHLLLGSDASMSSSRDDVWSRIRLSHWSGVYFELFLWRRPRSSVRKSTLTSPLLAWFIYRASESQKGRTSGDKTTRKAPLVAWSRQTQSQNQQTQSRCTFPATEGKGHKAKLHYWELLLTWLVIHPPSIFSRSVAPFPLFCPSPYSKETLNIPQGWSLDYNHHIPEPLSTYSVHTEHRAAVGHMAYVTPDFDPSLDQGKQNLTY